MPTCWEADKVSGSSGPRGVSVLSMSDVPPSDLFANRPDLAPDPADEVDPEAAEAMTKELAEARARLLETEVSTVLVNHALGIYELAAIHLTAPDPDMVETRLAIDAFATLVEGLEGRLGEQEPMLNDALAQIKMGFVQRVQAMKDADTEAQS